MIQRPLMTPDELKSLPKGHFIVMKTGTHPMFTPLHLFPEWGMTFGKPYQAPEKAARQIILSRQKCVLTCSPIGIRGYRRKPAAEGISHQEETDEADSCFKIPLSIQNRQLVCQKDRLEFPQNRLAPNSGHSPSRHVTLPTIPLHRSNPAYRVQFRSCQSGS